MIHSMYTVSCNYCNIESVLATSNYTKNASKTTSEWKKCFKFSLKARSRVVNVVIAVEF